MQEWEETYIIDGGIEKCLAVITGVVRMAKEVTVNKVIEFVKCELCNDGSQKNASVYLCGAFIGGKKLKLVFHKEERQQYCRLLAFCSAHNATVLETDPKSLQTVIRALNDVNKYFVANRETKEVIREAKSFEEGKKLISEFEKEDKKNGVFEKGFYDIIDDSNLSYFYDKE